MRRGHGGCASPAARGCIFRDAVASVAISGWHCIACGTGCMFCGARIQGAACVLSASPAGSTARERTGLDRVTALRVLNALVAADRCNSGARGGAVTTSSPDLPIRSYDIVAPRRGTASRVCHNRLEAGATQFTGEPRVGPPDEPDSRGSRLSGYSRAREGGRVVARRDHRKGNYNGG